MAAKKFKRHRIRRWIIQIFFFVLFIFLFIQTKYGQDVIFQNLFFRFDPLILIVLSIAYRTLVTSALVSLFLIVGTFIFGRFFCGFICPLGTTIDIFDSFIKRKEKKISPKNGKYLILLFLVLSAIIGSSFVHFFDPLSILERSLTLIIYPVITYIIGIFTALTPAVYTETVLALIIFAIILGLGFITPRFWCRNLCPLGGMLAIISKFSLFKVTFLEGCTECGICGSVCPTGAIDFEMKKIDSAECIDCLRCQHECPQSVIRYKLHMSFVSFDIKRRHIITAIGTGFLAAPLSRFLIHSDLSKRLIRPPGSIPEPDFLNACVHCGMCMKICPTNGLQPCLFEAGVNGLWTPRLVPVIGGCEKNCNMCGQVCPTSAIRKLSLEEKTYAKMGSAVIDRSRCIAWEQDKVCLICDEICQYNAISSLNETVRDVTILRPFVDERICTGCGLCESRCPIEGPSAIQVYSIGEERKRFGSYITEEKKKLRECEKKVEDIPSGFIIDNK